MARGTRTRKHRLVPDELAAQIGGRIRALRSEQKISFDEFVERTGLGRGYVSELERGLVVPTVGTLARVATVLGVTLADLVVGESDRERVFSALRGAPASTLAAVRRLVRRAKKP
ncbi:MAG TPA: helix-turn-helix transcriptional regulator [Labilithrix sp.]